MEVLHVFENMKIQSASGFYEVEFDETRFTKLPNFINGSTHFILDTKLADCYPEVLKEVINNPNTILINSSEYTKEITRVLPIVENLLKMGLRREHSIVAIGGGVVQDITCFISSILFRGVNWNFIPTTLVAQADSCIGSKSSINFGEYKNIVGTFNPPKKILICPMFLETLDHEEVLSGIGEIIKVHAIDGSASFDNVSEAYENILSDSTVLLSFIKRALEIKKKFIELDEFDQGIRNIFNYGHSFGHAIESATQFTIPHGIAVTIGMDMANRIAAWRNLLPEDSYNRMHGVLRKNYQSYISTKIPLDQLVSAIKKDKKNTAESLVLIMPVGEDSRVKKVEVTADKVFSEQCARFLNEIFI